MKLKNSATKKSRKKVYWGRREWMKSECDREDVQEEEIEEKEEENERWLDDGDAS